MYQIINHERNMNPARTAYSMNNTRFKLNRTNAVLSQLLKQ